MTQTVERPAPGSESTRPVPGRRLVRVRRVALAVWGIAAVLQAVLDGIPFDRLSMFVWVGSLLLAASIGRRGMVAVLVDFGPFVLVLVGYDYLRGLAGRLGMPTLWTPQLRADRFLFGGHDPTIWLQAHLKYAQPRWWDVPVALCYVSYFVMPTIVAGVLWLRSRTQFRRWAGRYVGLCLLAFTMFALLPSAPPWAAGRCTPAEVAGRPQDPLCMHLAPTHSAHSLLGNLHPVHAGAQPYVQRIAYRGFAEIHLPRAGALLREGQAGVDLVAAVPSLHSAGVLLLTLFLWRRTRRWWTRSLLLAYPLLMTFTLVYAGEHYVTDVLAGWLAAGVVHLVANRVEATWADARRRRMDGSPPASGVGGVPPSAAVAARPAPSAVG